MTLERPQAVTMDGTPFTLVGQKLRVGSRAPEFTVQDTAYQPLGLATHAGKTRILLSVSSLDTPVCDLEAREFSRRVQELPDVAVYVISVDLPAAQRRWCGAAGVANIAVGSDHREVAFGRAYGVLIKELRVLSRAAFVVNPGGEVTYVEYVPEVARQPDVDAVIRAAKEAAAAPA